MAFAPASGVGITITVDHQEVSSTLEQILWALNNLEAPLLAVGSMLSERFNINFQTTPWPPLEDSTIKLKRALGYPVDSLVRTGDMKDAATGGSWSAGRKGPESFEAVLEVPGYSRFHFLEDGTRFMPQRDYAMITSEEITKAIEIFVDWINDAIDG